MPSTSLRPGRAAASAARRRAPRAPRRSAARSGIEPAVRSRRHRTARAAPAAPRRRAREAPRSRCWARSAEAGERARRRVELPGPACRDLGQVARCVRRGSAPSPCGSRTSRPDRPAPSARARRRTSRRAASQSVDEQTRLTPGSSNWLAIVGKTGISSSAASKATLVALPLLAHVAQRVVGAALVELVDTTITGRGRACRSSRAGSRRRYSLVITYTGTSTRSTISESLWPMPAVSTITRSNPCVRRNATRPTSIALVARCWRRVAIERMKTLSLRRLFMRMRSPSSAPPVRRRVGSTASDRDPQRREVRAGSGRAARRSPCSCRRRPCR